MKLLNITAAAMLALIMGTAFAAGTADDSTQITVINTSSVSLHALYYGQSHNDDKLPAGKVDFFVMPGSPTDPQSTKVTIKGLPQNAWINVTKVSGGADDAIVGTFGDNSVCQIVGDTAHQALVFGDTGSKTSEESVYCTPASAARK